MRGVVWDSGGFMTVAGVPLMSGGGCGEPDKGRRIGRECERGMKGDRWEDER